MGVGKPCRAKSSGSTDAPMQEASAQGKIAKRKSFDWMHTLRMRRESRHCRGLHQISQVRMLRTLALSYDGPTVWLERPMGMSSLIQRRGDDSPI